MRKTFNTKTMNRIFGNADNNHTYTVGRSYIYRGEPCEEYKSGKSYVFLGSIICGCGHKDCDNMKLLFLGENGGVNFWSDEEVDMFEDGTLCMLSEIKGSNGRDFLSDQEMSVAKDLSLSV